jgi:hypothetical protein
VLLAQVYDATREAADWCDLLQPQQTLGIHCLHFYNNSNVTNSQLVQRRVRDAVCDAVRDARYAAAVICFCVCPVEISVPGLLQIQLQQLPSLTCGEQLGSVIDKICNTHE